MAGATLFDDGTHQNLVLPDFGHGQMVQANQHLIVDSGAGMILDPGGHKVYGQAFGQTMALLRGKHLRYVFLSHQDPDIVAALNGWLMTTDAVAYASQLWVRFIPHFGLDALVADRLKPIPDEGAWVTLGSASLAFVPAHFLHSPGNFHVWDAVSKVLYTGDLGASLGMDYAEVTDFDRHLPYMEGFHRRYMASGRALKAWVGLARSLPVETIAPQHGAFLRGREVVARFLDWCEGLSCGTDLLPDVHRMPERPA